MTTSNKNQMRADVRRFEFEKLKEVVDEMPEIIIDFEPGEIYFPAIYNPADFAEIDKQPDWYGITVPAEVVLNEVNDIYIKDKLKANIRPPVGACQFERIHIKSKLRPEVYTIKDDINDKEQENDPLDLLSLQAQLFELDTRNRPRDHIFIGCHVRVHTKPYAYWSGELALMRDNIDYLGVGMGLKKVGIWMDD